ncbi:MAG: hypothetical protein ACXW3Z_02105 [Limisphaerales bacterium]
MKKTIIDTIRSALRIFQRSNFHSKRSQEEQIARDAEAERLDRIRNPRDYRPNQDE